MIRKDFVEAEIQKLNQVLARILGLKNDGNTSDAQDVAMATLEATFHLNDDVLLNESAESFIDKIQSQQPGAAKLDMLARFLFEAVYPFEETDRTFALLNKAAAVLALLESAYRQQSLDNIARRDQIEKFLNNRQYE